MQQLQMVMILALCVSIACLLTTTVDSYRHARITTRSIIYGSLSSFDITMLKIRNTALAAVLRDEKGYEVKPKDWFNGLSLDPGASLTDPRAVPDECRLFAERIKSGDTTTTLQETISLLDKHYEYFQVPFTCGDVVNQPNQNTGSAKIFSFGLMTKMTEEQTLRMFGEVYRDLDPSGSDHQNIRNFIRLGWSGVTFSSGLAILSKLQSYDDTDAAFSTQASITGGADWSTDADSWIP